MDFVKNESLATYEKWLLALLLVVVMVHVYYEITAWHVSIYSTAREPS